MPLTPTPGGDAILGGMSTVNGAAAGSAADIDEYINRACDYIANGPLYWKPGVIVSIARGGTGATTAAGARTALGIPTTAAQIGAAADGIGTGLTFTSPGFNRIVYAAPGVTSGTELARQDDVSSRVSKTGDTMSGDLFLPGSSAASSGWSAAYINSDGRVCRGASSLRYKKFVREWNPDDLGDIFPQFNRFQMRADGNIPAEGKWRYGPIAEQMAAHPDQEQFVVWRDIEGLGVVPDSVDFTAMLVAQVAQLHQRDQERAEREAERDMWIEQLLNRVESLENAHADN